MERTKTDEELQKILESYNENELHGLKLGLLPLEKTPENLSGKDVARLMEMNPKGHY